MPLLVYYLCITGLLLKYYLDITCVLLGPLRLLGHFDGGITQVLL